MHENEKARILTIHKNKLDRLVDILRGTAPENLTATSVDITVYGKNGSSQTVTLDTAELDTYLLLTGLSELAQTRAEYLNNRLKELKE